jgi:signal transduction histidine kinase
MSEKIPASLMSGRRIFIKIYLCFILASILVIAMQLLLDFMTDSGPFRDRRDRPSTEILTTYGQSAVEKYIADDKRGLTEAAGNLHKSRGIETYILDQENREIRNLRIPPHADALAERVRRSGKAEESPGPPAFLIAAPVTGSDKKIYIVIGESHRPVFGPPAKHGEPPPPKGGPGGFPFEFELRLLIVLSVSGLVCFIFARYLTAPVMSLREATRRFASGDLKARVGSSMGGRKDELSDLANDFDMMAGRIESLMTAQRQLLGDISHELRTPLTRLNLALELARTHAGPDAEKALNRVERESENLNGLIDELLTFTRMEVSLEKHSLTAFDITNLIHEIVADADFEAGQSNRTVDFTEDKECQVTGDRELLRRAIENVVRNAIRYTPENSVISINMKLSDKNVGAVEIAIRDSGPGVPNSELANIFTPFYRISNARERKTGGVGLGLAITERAVRLHGGTVAACNAEEGGLLVTITLPLSEKK